MSYLKKFEVKDKVAVITGGGGILCSEMAFFLGEEGAKIALLDINEKALAKVSEELEKRGISHLTVKTDVMSKKSIEQASKKILNKFERVDFLINGAGGNHPNATTKPDNTFFDLPEEAIEKVMNLNFMGTFLPSQVFGKIMARQKKGNIINISSMSAFTPLTRIPAYSASKAAINNFTQWLAVYMSQFYSKEIRVNAIAPGFLLTDQNRYLLCNPDDGTFTERGKKIINRTPAGRFGDPEDLLSTLFWLLSPASAFVHGAVIPVDGGFSAYTGV